MMITMIILIVNDLPFDVSLISAIMKNRNQITAMINNRDEQDDDDEDYKWHDEVCEPVRKLAHPHQKRQPRHSATYSEKNQLHVWKCSEDDRDQNKREGKLDHPLQNFWASKLASEKVNVHVFHITNVFFFFRTHGNQRVIF